MATWHILDVCSRNYEKLLLHWRLSAIGVIWRQNLSQSTICSDPCKEKNIFALPSLGQMLLAQRCSDVELYRAVSREKPVAKGTYCIIQHHPASISQVLAMIVVACYYVGDLVFPWMRQCGWCGASQIVSFWCPPQTLHRIWDFAGWLTLDWDRNLSQRSQEIGQCECLIFCTNSNSLPGYENRDAPVH